MNLPWYIPIIIVFVFAFLLGRGCQPEPVTKVVTETVYKTDTVVTKETPEPVYVDKPYPVYVDRYIPTEPDPPDFTLDQMRTYIDTAVFDGLSLGYEIKTRGTLESAVFSPTFERETITNTITTTNTIDNTKPLRGIYGGARIGGNQESFSTLSPSLLYVAPKISVGVDYNFIDETYNVTVAPRLFGW